MKTYVVRVVQTRQEKWVYLRDIYPSAESPWHPPPYNFEGGEIPEQMLQVMEAAGHITNHGVDPNGLTTLCFDINPPSYHSSPCSSHAWATVLTEKMRKMGFNAVVAPSTLISSHERIEECRK